VTDVGYVIEARGVTKWFGETTALDGVDFAVSPGVVHGLLGPNGAGKTTLLAVLLGLVLADEGTVRLFGRTRSEAGAAMAASTWPSPWTMPLTWYARGC